MYALRGGFLVRPLAIAVILGRCGGRCSRRWKESTRPDQRVDPEHPISLHTRTPAVAQVILSSIATSIMAVVSIVFAILLMTLTLASTQFSPRILISFRSVDRTTQWTLGVFACRPLLLYCIAALPAARALPHPFVPVATVTGAMVLALVCVGCARFVSSTTFPARSASATIVDRIARETELVIDQLMPYPRGRFPFSDRRGVLRQNPDSFSRIAGQLHLYVDINGLVALRTGPPHSARASGARGQFARRYSAGARVEGDACRDAPGLVAAFRYWFNAHITAVWGLASVRIVEHCSRHVARGQRSVGCQLRGPAQPIIILLDEPDAAHRVVVCRRRWCCGLLCRG